MEYHYVYRITNIKLNKHYYGTRTSKNIVPIEDIGIYYYSSSMNSLFIEDQRKNPKDYRYKIVRTYKHREDALLLECILHNKFNVDSNDNFYNDAKQSSTKFNFLGGHSIPHTISGI